MSSCSLLARAGVLVVLLLAATWAAPAQAAWGSFVSMGKTLLESDPSCAPEGAGVVFCAAIGPNSRLVFNRWVDGWTGWTAAPDVVTAPPSCANNNLNGTVICAARSGSLEMITYIEVLGKILPSAIAKVIIGSAPSCAPLTESVMCAARSPSGELVAAWYDGTGNWTSADWFIVSAVASKVNSAPSCARYAGVTGDVVCAWVTDASAIATREFLSPKLVWGVEQDIGGMATNPPVCSAAGLDNTAGCFGTGTDSALWFDRLAPTGPLSTLEWSGWNSLEGLVHGYSCVDYGAGPSTPSYVCGVTGLTNSGFWTTGTTGSGWSGWVEHGTGAYIGAPSCVAFSTVSPGQVMCVVTQQNGQAVSIVGP